MRTAIAGLMALLFSACSTGSQANAVDDLRAELTAANLETSVHRHNSANATSMPTLRDELARHEHRMDDVMTGMHEAMDEGMFCSGMEHVGTMMNGMTDEMRRHHEVIDAATDVEASRSETDRHAMAMFDMVDKIDGETSHMSCMDMGMHTNGGIP